MPLTQFRTRWSPCLVALPAALSVLLIGWAAKAADGREGSRALVLPVSANDEHLEDLLRLSTEVAAELEALGRDAVDPMRAQAEFVEEHSRDPVRASQEDIDVLETATREALKAIVQRRYGEARTHVEEARTRAERALETLNRDLTHAQDAFDACVAGVRLALEAHQDQVGAAELAEACLRESPELDVSERDETQPYSVREVFARARDRRAKKQTAAVTIKSSPDKCPVYIMGHLVGKTGLEWHAPSAGHYRVQVECVAGELGRVHHVVAGDQTAELTIDAVFDRAVRTDRGALRLGYPGNYHGPTEDLVRDHARQLLELLHSPEGVLLVAEGNGGFLLRGIGRGPQRRQTLPSDYSREDLRRAVQEIFAAEPETAPPPKEVAHGPGLSRWRLAVGTASLGAGAGLLTAGWWKYSRRREFGLRLRSLDPDSDASSFGDAQQSWLDARPPMYTFAAVGAGIGSLGGAFVAYAPTRASAWLPWAFLAGGAALATPGIVALSRWDTCEPSDPSRTRQPCAVEEEKRDRGGLLLLTSTPLWIVSTIGFLRLVLPRASDRVQVGAHVSARAGVLTVSGAL